MPGDDDLERLQRSLAAFVRAFGLHRQEETPCGAPVPTSEAHALAVLDEHGPLAQTDLARHLALAKSTVSRMVDHLVARGWIDRERPADRDGRTRIVYLTGPGRQAAADIGERRRARLADLLDRLPPDQRTTVIHSLDLLAEASHHDIER